MCAAATWQVALSGFGFTGDNSIGESWGDRLRARPTAPAASLLHVRRRRLTRTARLPSLMQP